MTMQYFIRTSPRPVQTKPNHPGWSRPVSDINQDWPAWFCLQDLTCRTIRNPAASVSTSVRNGPGPRQGPAGGLPRAPDGTGQHNAVHTRPSNLRTAVLMEDRGPCKVRHFSVGDCRGLPGTTGDYESYQQHFMTPFSRKYRNSSNKIKRNLRQSSRDK